MKILNRAKSIYSDEYLISEDIKFELGLMYFRINGKWKECDKDTRSINFEDMLDSQGNKIFASLSEDGKGGDIVKHEQVLGGILKSSGPKECIIKYCNRDHIIAPFFINAKYKNQKTYMTKEHLLVIGIQE